MVIRGENVLEKEIKHAWDVSAVDRVYVRTDDALIELQ